MYSMDGVTHENDHASAELKRLEIIETVARSVREEFDSYPIARAAVQSIVRGFHPIFVCVHFADHARQELHLLYMYGESDEPSYGPIDEPTQDLIDRSRALLQRISFQDPLLIAQSHSRREPITVEDLHHAAISEELKKKNLLTPISHGYICVPLWFKDHFEGALTAIFRATIALDGPEARTLTGCSTHIAGALAHSRLHAELEQERTRTVALVDQLPEGIFFVDAANRRVSYANPASAHILGLSLQQLSNVSFALPDTISYLTNLHGQPVQLVDVPSIRALQGEVITGQELVMHKRDGTRLILLISAAPIRDAKGAITGAVTVFQDITARKSLEQQRSEFLSIASHELRTPTTAIQGFAEILQMLVDQNQDLRSTYGLRAIRSISEQSQRLARLIEEMLDISCLEYTELELHKSPHDLLATVRQVIESQSLSSGKRPLRLILEGLSSQDQVMGIFDEDRLVQVLNNLINNALKYSEPESEIHIGLRYPGESNGSAQEAGRDVLLWVRDFGIGIPASELSRIFKRFHRARNFDRAISGLGIGLYLSYEIITRHGGILWAESTEGSGSTFYMRLPLGETPFPALPAES